tara:strand:+ start:499 stop:837 length:339 start_codon:yes stop_codon:yes gene_type:complete
MKAEFKIITLDYDDIAWKECKERIDFILQSNYVKSIKVFSSPLGDGYHLYVMLHQYMEWNLIMRLRRKWKDDGQRVMIDLMKERPEVMMIIFRSKTRKGYKYKEIWMGEYAN